MLELILGNEADAEIASQIYDSVRGRGLTVWSESYPHLSDAIRDARAGCLYILRDNGANVGCCSVEPGAEDDDLPFWKICDGSHREISRIAVSFSCQGRGYAKTMVQMLIERLMAGGVRSIHLLCAKKNLPAVKTYRALGFEFIGECYRYGADYYVCEKLL